jgi:hypothetical protein
VILIFRFPGKKGKKEGRAPLHALTPKTIPPESGIYQTPQTNTLLELT